MMVFTWVFLVASATVPAFAMALSSPEARSIGPQRCLIAPPRQEELYPTLVLIGGMAQTITSWERQIPTLSKNRQVVVYECAGQGKGSQEIDKLENVSLPKQAETLLKTLDLLVGPEVPIDLAGFSFGGRVGMATACLQPHRIHKLHLTGVASDRSNYGHLAIEAWKDCLQYDPSLRSFAWSVLLATYSPDFLRTQPIERYISHICETNSRDGLLALLEQAEVSDTENPWHVANMAKRLSGKVKGRLCVGELDQMAPVHHAHELSSQLGWVEPCVVPGCGHAVGLEGGRRWREDVLSFLDSN